MQVTKTDCEKHRDRFKDLVDKKILQERELRRGVDSGFNTRILVVESDIDTKIGLKIFLPVIGVIFALMGIIYNHSSNVDAGLRSYQDGTFDKIALVSEQLVRIEEQTKALSENFKRLEANSQ